ncbi:uncharacterized protein LAJ45_09157 [Morchella importuna]|nr:uncharacterized protein LAJ45_09157 [Morchella importuna]KAH8146783.1 hypothetical protein LAJ45_09157 [Morchella importuna]
MTRKGKEKDPSKPDRATWTPEMERLLIKALLVEIHQGRKAENGHGMTKEGWQNAHSAFNKHSKQPLELMQIKNKANALKKEYAVFSAMKESGEFAWDEATGTPSANNEVWDRYVETNPIAKKYRGRALSNYALLSKLVSTAPLSPTTLDLALTPESLPTKRSRDDSDDSSNDGTDKFDDAEEHGTSGSENDDEAVAPNRPPVILATPAPIVGGGGVGVGAGVGAGSGVGAGNHQTMKRMKRSFAGEVHNHQSIASALTTFTQTLGLSPTTAQRQTPPTPVVPSPVLFNGVDNIQCAITTLQNDYDKKMSVEDLVACLSIFESELKAKMFVAMKKGMVRDAWLEKEIRVYRRGCGEL